MGYHDAVEHNKKLIKQAVGLANDRARLEHGLRLALSCFGTKEERIDQITSDVREANFASLERRISAIQVSTESLNYLASMQSMEIEREEIVARKNK